MLWNPRASVFRCSFQQFVYNGPNMAACVAHPFVGNLRVEGVVTSNGGCQ